MEHKRRVTEIASLALHGCRIDRALGASVEIVEAEPGNRRFPERVTETLGVCLKIGGDHEVVADGRERRYPRDSVCVRSPGCVWATASTGPVGFLSLDIEAHWLPEGPGTGGMHFLAPRELPDLRDVVRTLRGGETLLEQETALTQLVSALLERGVLRSDGLDTQRVPGAAGRARELLLSRLDASPSLAELAEQVGCNRFVLLREFRRRFGVPPHAFALRARLERSRYWLARGSDVADVAQRLGFADQSHLSRHFKRVFGVSPGAYARQARRQVTIV